MDKRLAGFMEFVRERGVVGLAVGLAIGTQVGETVKTIVGNLINPIIGFIVGDTEGLEALETTFKLGDRAMTIGWGAVLSTLITLLAVSAVIYFVVNGLGLDRADRKAEK